MRQLLSDIDKLGCGCHTRAPKPISVSCVSRGAEARTTVVRVQVVGTCEIRTTHVGRHARTRYRVGPGLRLQ